MFHINRNDFHRNDETQLAAFVACWERYYRGSVSISPMDAAHIDYEGELNIQGDLTAQNMIRLLRWKDPRMLTHPKADGTDNHRVTSVLNRLGAINNFRNGKLDRQDFAQATATLFPNGIVWRLFLFHIAQPWDWPIADQHVFRAHAALFGNAVPQTLDDFELYRSTFARLAGALQGIQNGNRVEIVQRNKRLDNALMSYGQFLLAYDR